MSSTLHTVLSPGGAVHIDIPQLIQFHGGKVQISLMDSPSGISMDSVLASLTDAVAVINALTVKVDQLESRVSELSRPVIQYDTQF